MLYTTWETHVGVDSRPRDGFVAEQFVRAEYDAEISKE